MRRSRRGELRPAVFAVATLATMAALIAVTGCSGAPPVTDTGLESPDASPGATEPEQRVDPLPPPLPQPRVDVGYRMPRLGPDEAPGLVPRLAAMAAPELTVVARWATPAGSSVLGDALDARFASAVRSYAEEHGAAWSPGVDVAPGGVGAPCARQPLTEPVGASLTVDCGIVAAAGTVLGERLIVVRREGAIATAIDRSTWYADASTGELGDGAALYRPGAEPRVLALFAEALRSAGLAGVADPFAGLTAEGVRAVLADTIVTADDLVVPVPLTSAADGQARHVISVLVPVRLVRPFLSGFGAAVHAAIASGAPFEPPSAPTGDDRVDCTLVACVSITFDDGPTSLTDGLIDTLRELRAPATFFVQGGAVDRRPDEARRLVDEGHELGNHTWSHPYLTKLPDPEVQAEIQRTQEAVHAAVGVWPRSLRPPYGDVDQRVRDLAGLPVIVWDVDTNDWQRPDRATLIERAVTGASRGSIVLMHDTHDSTIDAVPDIIAGLRDRGFTLATVSEQFGGALPDPGELVSHGPR